MARANWSVDEWVQILDKTHSITAVQGNVVHTQEFARRYGDKILSVSVHPGSTHASIRILH